MNRHSASRLRYRPRSSAEGALRGAAIAFVIAASGATGGVSGAMRVPLSPASLLPASNEIRGWARIEPPKTFAGNRLFDYMDGAGEIPMSYGFQQLASARYRQGTTSLEVAVFDMGSPEDAFGYYSARSFLEHNPGAADQIVLLDHPAHIYTAVGVLTFWKDRYTIIVQPESGKAPEATLLQFAKSISRRVTSKGAPPELLKRLPSAHREPNSERYVKGKAAFDSLLVFSPRDVFGASAGAKAVAAEYLMGKGVSTLFVVRYRDGKSRQALAAYRQFLISRKAEIAPARIPNGFAALAKHEKGTAAAVEGDYLLGVVGAADTTMAQTGLRVLLASLRAK